MHLKEAETGWIALEQIEGTDDYELVFDTKFKYKKIGDNAVTVDLECGEANTVSGFWGEDLVYLYDLTDDGIPEICIDVYTKSESSSKEVQVYDWVMGNLYSLSAVGKFDYELSVHEGELYVTEKVRGVLYSEKSGKLVLKANGGDYVLAMDKSE